jgi:hypothetical protein
VSANGRAATAVCTHSCVAAPGRAFPLYCAFVKVKDTYYRLKVSNCYMQ